MKLGIGVFVGAIAWTAFAESGQEANAQNPPIARAAKPQNAIGLRLTPSPDPTTASLAPRQVPVAYRLRAAVADDNAGSGDDGSLSPISRRAPRSLTASLPSRVGSIAPARGHVSLNVSRGQTLRLSRPAASIFIADPAIADLQAPSNDALFVFGKKPGRTSLFALDDQGESIVEYSVAVTAPIEDLRELLRSEIGDHSINVTYTPNGAVISGSLPNAGLVESAKSITAQFLGSGATITNRMRIASSMQVNLQVRVAEVNRSVLKRFGINLSGSGRFGPLRVGGTTNSAQAQTAAGTTAASNATNGLGSLGRGLSSLANGGATGGGSGQTGNGQGGGQIGISYSDGVNSISAQLDALAQDGLVSILAEPNLTAISGEKANFLAGGEIPIPITQALGQTSVQYRRFGASLEFQPTVLSNNLINVRVRPEVSEINNANSVQLGGITIPGLSTRSADTVVELASGQSFAIGGLIRKNFSTNVGTVPGLGDLPILGALFRSSQFQKDESELVIIVTPYIVRAANSPQALETPADRVAPPTDNGRVLLNTLSRTPPKRLAPRQGSVGLTGDVGLSVE